MCPLTEYEPHRERLPIRYCSDCSCLLASDNETDTCSPCDPGEIVMLWTADKGVDVDGLADLMEQRA